MIKSGLFWFFLLSQAAYASDETEMCVGQMSFKYMPSGYQLEYKACEKGRSLSEVSISLKEFIPKNHNRCQMSSPVVSNEGDKIAVWFTSYLEAEQDPYKFGFVSSLQFPKEKSSLFVFDRAGKMLSQHGELGVEGALCDLKFLNGHRVILYPYDQGSIEIEI